MRLTFAGDEHAEATVLGDDPDTDLALLQRTAAARARQPPGSAIRSDCDADNSSWRSAIRWASNGP